MYVLTGRIPDVNRSWQGLGLGYVQEERTAFLQYHTIKTLSSLVAFTVKLDDHKPGYLTRYGRDVDRAFSGGCVGRPQLQKVAIDKRAV